MRPHFDHLTCPYNHPCNLHQKSVSLLQSVFTSLSHSFLFTKSSIQSPLTLPFSISQQFSPPQFCSQPPQKPEIFSLPQSFIQFKLHHRYQGARESCDDQHCLDLSLLPQSMDSDNEVYDHWFLNAQFQKIGVMQVVVSDVDVCHRNGKPFNSTFSHNLNFLSLFPYLTDTITRTPHSPGNQLLNLIFILILLFSYTIYAPLYPYV